MKRIILIFIAIVSFSFIEEKVDQDAIDLKSSYVFWEGSNSFRNHRGIIKFKSGSVKIINGVLKSADFFEVAAYPTAKFVITKVEESAGKLSVTGNLNIKDVTKSITIPAMLSEIDGSYIFKSDKFNIDRADFNVKYKSKKFFDNLKGKFVNDLVEMSFEVKASK